MPGHHSINGTCHLSECVSHNLFSFLRTIGTNRRSSSNISSQGTIINFSLWQICDYLGTSLFSNWAHTHKS